MISVFKHISLSPIYILTITVLLSWITFDFFSPYKTVKATERTSCEYIKLDQLSLK